MFIKTQFSIKDLENLSGVKAHTIRIWEKRYNLLEPARTDTNIRKYDLINLKKLLNITLLYNEGYKISKIAGFKEEEITKLIHSLSKNNKEDFALQAFKTAMFDFDRALFNKTYKELAKTKNFREIFYEVFLPLLHEIGLLWQTGTIDPTHERFISELIKQKILINTTQLQEKYTNRKVPSFVLYLPYEEIHEIGLLFANYEIILAGFDTVYLGSNIPMEGLSYILKHYEEITFLSYFTVKPDKESLYEYVDRFQKTLGSTTMPLWVMGYKTLGVIDSKLPKNVKVVESLEELRMRLQKLKSS